tara:strand:+ start:517 stop:1260 length:744 start_codon:yes stop_codon:yes gene_type:complete
MSYLILGASSGLGRDLAYTFAKNLHNLTLISRDDRDLAPIKSDLENKFQIKVNIYKVDASSKDEVSSFLKNKETIFNDLDGVLFPIGMMSINDCISKIGENADIINNANYLSIVRFIEKIMPIFERKNNGTIVGFGSVASSLGRKTNVLYSASKRALNSYFESLISTSNDKNIKTQFYILGYLDTSLASDKDLIFPKASTKELALRVYNNINKDSIIKYHPNWWRIICYTISIIPFYIIKKMIRFIK